MNDVPANAAENEQGKQKEDEPDTDEAANPDARPAASAAAAEDGPASVWILDSRAVLLQPVYCYFPPTNVLRTAVLLFACIP